MTDQKSFTLRALTMAGAAAGKLGFDGLGTVGSALGSLIWHTQWSRRDLAIQNIAAHLQVDEDTARHIARASFSHTGRSFTELLLTQDFGVNSPLLSFAQPQLWNALLQTDRPVVAACAHMGAWELMASILGEMYAPPKPRMVVTRRYTNPAVQEFITRQREATGATMVGHRTVAASVLRALRQKGLVAFLVDHNAHRSEAAFLPFLGEEAAVNIGPALLATRAEALIWPVFLLREGNGYVFHLQEPLDTLDLTGSREEKVHTAALFYTQAVEKIIKRYPEQWFWMHNRWKTKSS